jgi:hypothetical protein
MLEAAARFRLTRRKRLRRFRNEIDVMGIFSAAFQSSLRTTQLSHDATPT